MVEVGNGVLQRQILQIFSRQLLEWRREPPVSVLKDDDGSTNLLRNDTGGSRCGGVTARTYSAMAHEPKRLHSL
jgi:hypothetical protein